MKSLQQAAAVVTVATAAGTPGWPPRGERVWLSVLVTPPNLWYDPPRSDITGDGASLRELDPIAWRREIPVADRGHVHYVIAAVDSCYMTLHLAQAQHWHDVYRS